MEHLDLVPLSGADSETEVPKTVTVLRDHHPNLPLQNQQMIFESVEKCQVQKRNQSLKYLASFAVLKETAESVSVLDRSDYKLMLGLVVGDPVIVIWMQEEEQDQFHRINRPWLLRGVDRGQGLGHQCCDC